MTYGPSTSSALVAELEKFDTCTISDAMERLGQRGALRGLTRMTTAERVAGVAITVALVSADNDQYIPGSHLGAAAIDLASPGSIIVVAGGRDDCAAWGGLLSRASRLKGVNAVVVDGLVRDVDEAGDLGFAVFGRGPTPITARRRLVELETQTVVAIGDVTVTPGDLVIGDGSGVVVVPGGLVAEVLAAAADIAARERLMIERLERGESVRQVMNHDYEALLGGTDET